MRKATLTIRPEFPLMRAGDLGKFHHLQMPFWLFTAPRGKALSLEAKVAYTFLLDRFKLSAHNGWCNEQGEVYLVYTRTHLAEAIGVSYYKLLSALKELAAAGLIWEKRCGQGAANQIYLAQNTLEEPPVTEAPAQAPVQSTAQAPVQNPVQNRCNAVDNFGGYVEKQVDNRWKPVQNGFITGDIINPERCAFQPLTSAFQSPAPAQNAEQECYNPYANQTYPSQTKQTHKEDRQSFEAPSARVPYPSAPPKDKDEAFARISQILRAQAMERVEREERISRTSIERFY